jgi:hypothetical protein
MPAIPPRRPTCRQLEASEDDVNALAGEPGTLVEAVPLGARLGYADAGLQNRSSRRRATNGKHEEHTLAHRSPPKLACDGDDARRPRRRASRCDGDELGRAGLTHLGREDAVPQCVHAHRAPAQADDDQSDR